MTKNGWLVDVLSDLAAYCDENNMRSLKKVILEAKMVALIELVHCQGVSNYDAVMKLVFPEKGKATENPILIEDIDGNTRRA